ncbi:MAG: hypothetical protein M1839_007010 [Geoglossum umbratile]|nr:MAG: hypothetical protein M1839_007010 [Geoglossum umbratile]
MELNSPDSQDLKALLTADQQAELVLLVSTALRRMQRSLKETLTSPRTAASDERDRSIEGTTLQARDSERALRPAGRRDAELSALEFELGELKVACAKHFVAWKRSVITRLGEAVDPQKGTLQDRQAAPSASRPVTEGIATIKELGDPASRSAYQPISTPLSALPIETRTAIVSTILLLLLSLEHYSAYSRILLLYLTASLQLSTSAVAMVETQVAQSLLQTAMEMSADRETRKRSQENKVAWQWKVGLASVAGAALIGVTGGLAAPAVASGIGALMGGLGLGTTAAAGLLGALASNGLLIGGLFGAYGGRMTGKMMDAYAKEVEDFKFLPIRTESGEGGNEQDGARRLRVTIAISGWLTKEGDVLAPWRVLGQETDAFALRYELDALLELGNALQRMMKSFAWSYATVAIIKRTVLATLMAGVWPLFLLEMSHVVDNPFSVALSRSEKAGKVLADALINKAQGERPVSLIGYSLGSRVIYSCLMSLAERRAFGLVESVVFIGSPVPANTNDWRMMRSVVAGRMINAFSEDDYVLAILYRTSSVQSGIAGLQAICDVKGVENFDVNAEANGHLRYSRMMGSILKKVGWTDIQTSVIEEEEVREDMVSEVEEQDGGGEIVMIDREEEQNREERAYTATRLVGDDRRGNDGEFEEMEAVAQLFQPLVQDGKLVTKKLPKEFEFLRIARFLERSGKPEWSLRPRTYTVLRMINRVDVMGSFVSEGLYDISLPYSEKTLPDVFDSPTARSKFLEFQSLVLATQAADIESGEGRHRHFVEDGNAYFQPIGQLGKGGFGEVDHVWSRLSLNEFARKRIPRGSTFKKDKAAILDFERELETLKRLSHHHLVKYIGSYADPKYVGLIMSPVADSNLAQFLEISPFPAEQLTLLRCFYGCLSSAVCYLHENKIRHKDVKPMNILVHGKNILITDFGTSLDWTEEGHSTTSDTSTGPRTLTYCSPEVFNSEVSYGPSIRHFLRFFGWVSLPKVSANSLSSAA